MNLWQTVTGGDLTKSWKGLAARAQELPPEYQEAWGAICANIAPVSDFTGRNLLPILDDAMDLLEQAAADGLTIQEALGDDIPGFCAALSGDRGRATYRDRWRKELNENIARKIARLGG